ncbi:MAG TPA: prephenate dehydrogenase/arogenate dehydrogenase family protein [Hadesarchaea archaeon]|nr:prephenate dehydrogenase/arogenate dehydrogenase family protein [Hadesarchaea archaeon]
MKVAIIGAGAMGRWFADFAKKNLGEVVVADINTATANKVASELGITAKPVEGAVVEAEIILVCVPISKTPEVVKSVAERAQKGALVADAASVKSEAVETMQNLKVDVELVSIHPLFGPGVREIRGKDFVVVPVKPGKRYAKLKGLLTELGASVTEMDAEKHDRVMAVIQCMTHFILLAYLHSLKSLKGFKFARKLRTPMFARLMELAKSVLAGNPELYGELQVHNRYARMVRSCLLEACRSLDVAFSAGNSKSAKVIFRGALLPFGTDEIKRAYEELYKQFEGGTT